MKDFYHMLLLFLAFLHNLLL